MHYLDYNTLMNKWIDKEGIWWHENDAGETKKLLINPDTKQPYQCNEIIQEGKHKGKRFKSFRYDRHWVSNPDYWPYRFFPVAKNLEEYDNSYKLPTPAVISFSGGRTSAFLLRKILDSYNGKLPKDIIICFANTGKELDETLDFIHEIETRWKLPIHWLELDIATTGRIWRTKKVNYKTASRNGEPFEILLKKMKQLPSIYRRFCTIELKINVINRYMRQLGYTEWYSALGLRYDEPKRVSDAKRNSEKHVNICPLYEAKVTNEDVLDYWNKSPFDLKIPSIDGKTLAGNCDLCFLKGTQTTVNLLREKPELADWWIEQENKIGTNFKGQNLSYIKLVDLSKNPKFKTGLDDTHHSCFCHD